MPSIEQLNALPLEALRVELVRCCGASRWVEAMTRERPFRDEAHLFAAAERAWRALGREDWLEAFSHHPRIGEVNAAAASTRAWAAGEQAGAATAAEQTKRALAEGNRAYEARFGHVYLVCATGKSAEELLAFLHARLSNDADTELRVCAGEQEKITRLRLEKLLRS